MPHRPTEPRLRWTAAFDEDTNAYVSNKGWKEPADLLTSYRNLESSPVVPRTCSNCRPRTRPPEQLDAFYSKLGRPGNPDEYGLQPPEGGDPELTNWFKGTAHKLGLTAAQAKALYTGGTACPVPCREKLQAQKAQEAETELKALKGEWGQATTRWSAPAGVPCRPWGSTLPALGLRGEAGHGRDAQVVRHARVQDGRGLLEGGRSESGFGVTPAQARQEIADLKMDKQFMDNYLKGNPDAVSKMRRLMEQAHAGA